MKNIEWKQPAIDAGIVVAGGSLLDQYVVQNISFIGEFVAKLPGDVMGISIKAVILGAAALVTAKYFMR